MSHNKQPSYNRHKKYEVSFATDDKFGHVYDANQNCLVNNNNPESSKPTNESTSLVRNNNQSNKAKVGMIESDTIRENNTRSLSKPTQLQSFSFSNIYCHLLRLISMDHDGVRFAARMSVILSLCTLFVLCRWNHQAFPNGFWVYVTVLNVSWFPRLDAASVLEKTFQRWLGTMIGALLGLLCGFLSLFVHGNPQHGIFMFSTTLVMVFGILVVAGTVELGNRKRIIEEYSYATCLCILTLGVAFMPFASAEPHNLWQAGLFRVLNVSIGCLVGSVGSILLWPRPTRQVLYNKTAQQVVLAGEAVEAVLYTAYDVFSKRQVVPLLSQELLHTRYHLWSRTKQSTLPTPKPADIALEKYESAIADWMTSKTLFPLLRYDPFTSWVQSSRNVFRDETVNGSTKEPDQDIAEALARALRIQTTVVVLDGMIRYDADFEFDQETLQLFTRTGTLIRQLLTYLPKQTDVVSASTTVHCLFDQMRAVRASIRHAATCVVQYDTKNNINDSDNNNNEDDDDDDGLADFQTRLVLGVHSTRMDDNAGRGLPKYAATDEEHVQSNRLLFLQLIEHLILRSLRLYHTLTEPNMQLKLKFGRQMQK